MRLCVCGALVERSACSYVYRWVNIFARSVPVYALVDGYVGVCVYAPINVYVHECVDVLVAVYVCVYASACPSIHLCIYAPEQKIEIENRDHP